ncbi:MAG: NlpC/P60 family protein [Bacillota bacterium]
MFYVGSGFSFLFFARFGKFLLAVVVGGGILLGGFWGFTSSAAAAQQVYYRVKKGDCLWRIARQHGVTVSALKQANSLRTDLIMPGQVLYIPGVVPLQPAKPTVPETVYGRSPNASSRSGDNVIRDLLEYAWSLRGVRYRWAGENPATGFDCSGFTKHVFGRFGVSLPHLASAQYRCGIPVKREELAPGDILLFHTYSGIDHVAIHCGQGTFIHASSRGGGVRVDSLAERYWDTHFVGARRLLETER